MQTMTDPLTGQPITAEELQAEIELLELAITRSPNEGVERVLLEVLWQRTRLLTAIKPQGAQS